MKLTESIEELNKKLEKIKNDIFVVLDKMYWIPIGENKKKLSQASLVLEEINASWRRRFKEHQDYKESVKKLLATISLATGDNYNGESLYDIRMLQENFSSGYILKKLAQRNIEYVWTEVIYEALDSDGTWSAKMGDKYVIRGYKDGDLHFHLDAMKYPSHSNDGSSVTKNIITIYND